MYNVNINYIPVGVYPLPPPAVWDGMKSIAINSAGYFSPSSPHIFISSEATL